MKSAVVELGGWQKVSFVDYPGRLATVLFTQGCNWRCRYCHNPGLLSCRAGSAVPWEEVEGFLGRRAGQIDGVVITGGEPTLQAGLRDLLATMKARGLAVKLDTNGTAPDVVENLIRESLVDYLAMDLKLPRGTLERGVGAAVDRDALARSIWLLENLAPDGEARTTIVPGWHSGNVVEELLHEAVSLAGVTKLRRYALQPFVPSEQVLQAALRAEHKVTESELEELAVVADPFAHDVIVRA